MPPMYPVSFDDRGHGTALLAAFFLPLFGGIALDVWLHSGPVFTTFGAIAAPFALTGVFWFYREDFRN